MLKVRELTQYHVLKTLNFYNKKMTSVFNIYYYKLQMFNTTVCFGRSLFSSGVTSNLEVTPEEAWKFQVSSICCILHAFCSYKKRSYKTH
jgi:hypothetical protein